MFVVTFLQNNLSINFFWKVDKKGRRRYFSQRRFVEMSLIYFVIGTVCQVISFCDFLFNNNNKKSFLSFVLVAEIIKNNWRISLFENTCKTFWVLSWSNRKTKWRKIWQQRSHNKLTEEKHATAKRINYCYNKMILSYQFEDISNTKIFLATILFAFSV